MIRLRTLSILGCLCSLAACSKKPAAGERGAAAAPASATETAAPASATEKAAPASATEKAPPAAGELATLEGPVDCAKVLPAALVERHFAGAKVVPSSIPRVCGIDRDAKGAMGPVRLTITYECSIAGPADDVLDAVKLTRLPGIGRGAGMDDAHLLAFDSDTACSLDVVFLQKVPGLEPFVKDALDVLKPEMLKGAGQSTDGAPPSVEGDIACLKLLPQTVMERYYPKATVTAVEYLQSQCIVESGKVGDRDHLELIVDYDCTRPLPPEAVAAGLAAETGKKLEGLGRGAIDNGHELVAFDSDTSCKLKVGRLDPAPALEAFVKDLLEAITPETLRAAVRSGAP